MIATDDFAILLLVMALASYGCRVAGFAAMRFVPMTRRVEAALRATPLAVMTGICTVAGIRGGPSEWLSLALVAGVMAATRNDVLAAMSGVLAIALFRWSGFAA
jgi:uncharacterized membrane protein